MISVPKSVVKRSGLWYDIGHMLKLMKTALNFGI